MIKVEGHSNLVRDQHSKAIINTDNKGYNKALERRRLAKLKEKEFDDLKTEVLELKDMLGKLIVKLDK
jgi:hypothetical protein